MGAQSSRYSYIFHTFLTASQQEIVWEPKSRMDLSVIIIYLGIMQKVSQFHVVY